MLSVSYDWSPRPLNTDISLSLELCFLYVWSLFFDLNLDWGLFNAGSYVTNWQVEDRIESYEVSCAWSSAWSVAKIWLDLGLASPKWRSWPTFRFLQSNCSTILGLAAFCLGDCWFVRLTTVLSDRYSNTDGLIPGSRVFIKGRQIAFKLSFVILACGCLWKVDNLLLLTAWSAGYYQVYLLND